MYSYISKIYASDSFATFLIVSRETLIYGCELFSSELSCFTLDTNLLFGKIAKEMILFFADILTLKNHFNGSGGKRSLTSEVKWACVYLNSARIIRFHGQRLGSSGKRAREREGRDRKQILPCRAFSMVLIWILC